MNHLKSKYNFVEKSGICNLNLDYNSVFIISIAHILCV